MFAYVDGSTSATKFSRKRKQSSSQSQSKSKQEVPLEERLKEVLAAAATASDDKAEPTPLTKAEEVVVKLVKGLHASDAKLVDEAFRVTNIETVRSAVQRLPVQCLLPCLRELTQRIRSKIDVRSYVRWLHVILALHSSFLSSVPEIADELSNQHELMESRVNLMDKFMRLQGRLSLLLDQSSEKNQSAERRQLSEEAAKAVFIEGENPGELSDEDDDDMQDDYIQNLMENEDDLDEVDELDAENDSEEQTSDAEEGEQGKRRRRGLSEEEDDDNEPSGDGSDDSLDDDETSDI